MACTCGLSDVSTDDLFYFKMPTGKSVFYFLASLRLSDGLTVKLLCCFKDAEDSSACDIVSLVAMEVVRSSPVT